MINNFQVRKVSLIKAKAPTQAHTTKKKQNWNAYPSQVDSKVWPLLHHLGLGRCSELTWPSPQEAEMVRRLQRLRMLHGPEGPCPRDSRKSIGVKLDHTADSWG